jgi:hypothetical protein
MEEKDKIFRTEVWANPPIAPKIDENAAAQSKEFIKFSLISKQFNRRAEGPTFCQAKIIKEFLQESPSITWGSHKWKGAAPIFISSLKKIKKEVTEELERLCCKAAASKTVDRRIEEANAWMRKYFKVASFSRGEEKFISKAKTASIFISRPTHTMNHDEAEIEKIGPMIKRLRKIAFQGRISIQKGNISILGIWAQKLV